MPVCVVIRLPSVCHVCASIVAELAIRWLRLYRELDLLLQGVLPFAMFWATLVPRLRQTCDMHVPCMRNTFAMPCVFATAWPCHIILIWLGKFLCEFATPWLFPACLQLSGYGVAMPLTCLPTPWRGRACAMPRQWFGLDLHWIQIILSWAM